MLDNISPRLGVLVEDFLSLHGGVRLPRLGQSDRNSPRGDILHDYLRPLVEYFYVKGLEGKSHAEQREWRFNLITNYTFREGPLSGFQIGGAARWQDSGKRRLSDLLSRAKPNLSAHRGRGLLDTHGPCS